MQRNAESQTIGRVAVLELSSRPFNVTGPYVSPGISEYQAEYHTNLLKKFWNKSQVPYLINLDVPLHV